jgi:alkaline phosphatase D
MRFVCTALATLLLISGCTLQPNPFPKEFANLTHGVAAGEVTATHAVIWARCDRGTSIALELRALGGAKERTFRHFVHAGDDFIGKFALDGLQPGTVYTYRVWCGGDGAPSGSGRFSTAPPAEQEAAVHFVFGGDLGGQNVCRDRQKGYPIFDVVRTQYPDFFVALGDLIYADDPCKGVGALGNEQIAGSASAALSLATFREYWKYNRADPAFTEMLAATSMYSVWDDHEISNDAGPHQDTLPVAPATHLLEPALRAFLEYQPMLTPVEEPTRLYSSVRWGKHLELFILDLRQYRDANGEPDSAAKPKTMLGETQRRWLLDALSRSDATWKVIVSSVPLSIPTGATQSGHDGWTGYGAGDGFEHERQTILRTMQASPQRNYVWITTDVHFGAVFRYQPFPDDPLFTFHEIISGPLNAGVFPKEEYDRSLGTARLFRYAPATPIASYDEALTWFNFGLIDIAEDGALTAKLINGRGDTVYDMAIAPP